MSEAIEITAVELLPLERKHYATEVSVGLTINGEVYTFRADVCGYAPQASSRERDRGWEPDWGMDHTESEAHLFIANRIVKALKGGIK